MPTVIELWYIMYVYEAILAIDESQDLKLLYRSRRTGYVFFCALGNKDSFRTITHSGHYIISPRRAH